MKTRTFHVRVTREGRRWPVVETLTLAASIGPVAVMRTLERAYSDWTSIEVEVE